MVPNVEKRLTSPKSTSCRVELVPVCPQITLRSAFYSCWWKTERPGDYSILYYCDYMNIFLLCKVWIFKFNSDYLLSTVCGVRLLTLCLSQAATNAITLSQDRSKDVDELCTELLIAATFASDVVNLREQNQSNLKLELEGLQKKEEK